ncbi:MAG: glycosyl transferase [Paracoccaceae bacterium]
MRAPPALQGLILPDPDLLPETAPYLRLGGGAELRDGALHLPEGGLAGTDTWFNLFNLGKWQRHCRLSSLALELRGAGRVEVTLRLARPDGEETLLQRQANLSETPLRLDLPGLATIHGKALLWYELRAQTTARLDTADWVTEDAPRRQPELMLSITTFRREAAVRRTVTRFEAFMARSPLADRLHLAVVDNGQSSGLSPSAHVTPIPNENLGGSGGFARGLLEARARGATHCLFMDDDAAIHMESLERTWAFMAHAEDPATAVAGAISSAADKARIWENGAIFASRCWPRFNGLDLRDRAMALELEFETTGPPPPQHYGGWWFFAFPVSAARHMPFPFFVRGDDISFGLANPFEVVTLPGVLSFQSAMTLYLDLRSHLAHHLALPRLEIGRARSARIAAWFFGRSLLPCHYETLAALNLALEDVLRGPDFFARNADMEQRRADIAALRRDEVWRPVDGPLPADRVRLDPQKAWIRWLMKLTLNGHLLPFFGLWGNRVTLSVGARGNFRRAWGAARITYLDAGGTQAYTVRHSKHRALVQGLRMSRNIARLAWRYPRLLDEWRRGYEALTTEGFWRRKLGLPDGKAR